MMKFIIILSLACLSLNVFAGFNKELAVVKACDEAIQTENVSLSKIYYANAKVENKRITVELKYLDGETDCSLLSWFDLRGKATICPECDGEVGCMCVSQICSIGSQDKVVSQKYINN